jgi:hypothetical protein
MDDETKQLIMDLVNKLEAKSDVPGAKATQAAKGPLANPRGPGNMTGLNLPKLQSQLMPDPHFFRRLMGIDI